jgi:hypothetical protein
MFQKEILQEKKDEGKLKILASTTAHSIQPGIYTAIPETSSLQKPAPLHRRGAGF